MVHLGNTLFELLSVFAASISLANLIVNAFQFILYRFGHSDNVSLLASDDNDDIVDYIEGVSFSRFFA